MFLRNNVENHFICSIFILDPGDTLLLYTDGIIEAQPVKKETGKNAGEKIMFELDNLASMLCALGKEPVKKDYRQPAG